ncbi:hypothetical protein P9265_17380 [Schinkia azotoformans]|uniref:hypothetical protein n=1 Tax=Schinkia azotoformans TaxID=1454 RepID=UPI002E24DDA9|nr:hypothetical protein [Schinkia azotoformans]
MIKHIDSELQQVLADMYINVKDKSKTDNVLEEAQELIEEFGDSALYDVYKLVKSAKLPDGESEYIYDCLCGGYGFNMADFYRQLKMALEMR